MTRNIAETLIGAVVLAVAVIFLVFAYTQSDVRRVSGYTVVAQFTAIGTLNEGADVRISGIKVGSVHRMDIDPETYLARVTLSIDDEIKLPLDTSASIGAEGLLGGAFIALEPGGEDAVLAAGDEIQYTQAAPDLIGLITQLVFSQKNTN